MKINTQNYELKINETNGKLDIIKNEKPIITGIKFFINYSGTKLTPKNSTLEQINQDQASDAGGSYTITKIQYTNDENNISLDVKAYNDDPCLDFHIENDFQKPKFGEITGGIIADTFPLETAICYNNDSRGMEYWLKTVGSHFTIPWFILKPTLTHMFDAISITISKLQAMFSISRKSIDLDSFAYPDFVEDLPQIPNNTHYLITEIDDFYLGTIAKCGFGQKGYIAGEGKKFQISSIGADKTSKYNKIPCGTFAVSENPYDTTDAAYLPVNKEKDMKDFPEVFEYLGCCTWNSLYEEVSDESIRELVDSIVSQDIPLKFVIIDDGWQQIDDSKQLLSFEPNESFPDLKSTVKDLKSKGIEHVGIWHALQGDWEGVSPDGDIPEEMLYRSANGKLIPSPDGTDFYEKWYEYLSEQGIDFVKVDNQYDIARHTLDKKPIFEASTNLLNSVYEAADKNLETVLNCMSMVPECIYNDITNVSRTSIDYIPYTKFNAKYHLLYCIHNALWVSTITTPDYDMFQSHDPYAKPHALSKVLSGGPVYITDMIGRTDASLVRKLCFDDGKIPKPDQPARPTEDCLMKNSYENNVPLKAYTKTGEIGLVEAFNVGEDGDEEEVVVTPSDARLGENEYVIYGYFSEKRSKDKLSISLEELECELFIISPIEDGFASIGLVDVLNPPKGVQEIVREEDEIRISLYQSGEYAFYCEFTPSEIEGARNWEMEDSILRVDAEETEIIINKS